MMWQVSNPLKRKIQVGRASQGAAFFLRALCTRILWAPFIVIDCRATAARIS